MKVFVGVFATAVLFAESAMAALPPTQSVPEIGVLGGLGAVAAVGAVVALIWERRRRR